MTFERLIFDTAISSALEIIALGYKNANKDGYEAKMGRRNYDAYALRLVNTMTKDEGLRNKYMDYYKTKKEMIG